ncbi:MAG: LPXTG cell wall anchor domain-containing protein, partial [Fusicatenibacter sp.]|nr:LPXTG cell wall anchor domain-containing protein [Fusicatenibacter sp.]
NKKTEVKDGETVNIDLGTVDLMAGSITADVVNQAGSTLPETGGIGTTVLYVLGGVLVLAAVVLLVTRKRMSDAEK